MRKRCVVAVSVLLLLGCASASTTPSSAPRVITASEIEASQAGTALQVIERLRSEFLTPRPSPNLRSRERVYPTVIVDAIAHDDIRVLRNIPASEVAEIRFLSASEAQFKYGSGHPVGVIEVHTKR